MAPLIAAASLPAGWAAAWLARRTAGRWISRPPHLRVNYEGRSIPGTMGILLVAPLAVGAAAGGWLGRPGLVMAGLAVAMGIVGLLDDLYGEGEGGGFSSHLRALGRGHMSTGLVKAAAGGLMGLGGAWVLGWRGWWIVVAGAVIALSANLFNLFDRRPGRAAKIWLVGWGLLLAAGLSDGPLVVSAALAGGLMLLLPSDLKARAMLGDTGANLLGTALGVCAVVTLSDSGMLWLLGVLVALNVASEVVSFSTVIERTALLRAIDSWGR